MSAVSDPAFSPALNLLLGIEAVFVLAGAALLISRLRILLPRVLGLAPSPLTPSNYRASELFLVAAYAFGGAVVVQQIVALATVRHSPAPADGSLGFFHVLAGAGFQLGLLAGLGHAWFWHLRPRRRPSHLPPTPPHAAVPPTRVLRGGFITFLVALFLVGPAAVYWQRLLEWFHVDAPPQDLIRLFGRAGDTPSLLVLVVLAVAVAPLTEEIAFRVGIFRWLRGRAPRGVALLAPALLFAGIHGYLSVLGPLVVLALILALSYEHYGHPGVPILAHAFFNLNTIVLVLAGFPA